MTITHDAAGEPVLEHEENVVGHLHHVVSWQTYLAVYIALVLFTIVTVLVATVHLGEFNTIVAMSIAVAKMLLVLLFFMHVRWSGSVLRMIVLAGFIWFGIMVILTMSDYASRHWDQGGSAAPNVPGVAPVVQQVNSEQTNH